MSMPENKWLRAPLQILLVIAILVAVFSAVLGMKYLLSDRASGLADYGGDFTLQSVNGPVSLADYRGKVVPIYFGYTYCPDVCPTTMATLASVMDKLPPQEAQQVQPVFISIDPQRDTVEQVDKFVRKFDPRITGLTGSREEVNDVAEQYGVVFEKVNMNNSALGYTFDHSSVICIVGKDGELQSLIYPKDSIDQIIKKIRLAIQA